MFFWFPHAELMTASIIIILYILSVQSYSFFHSPLTQRVPDPNTDGKMFPYGFYFRVVSVEVCGPEKIVTLQRRQATHLRFTWKFSLQGCSPTTEMTNTVHRHVEEMLVLLHT